LSQVEQQISIYFENCPTNSTSPSPNAGIASSVSEEPYVFTISKSTYTTALSQLDGDIPIPSNRPPLEPTTHLVIPAINFPLPIKTPQYSMRSPVAFVKFRSFTNLPEPTYRIVALRFPYGSSLRISIEETLNTQSGIGRSQTLCSVSISAVPVCP
jgi:hypothetical protein